MKSKHSRKKKKKMFKKVDSDYIEKHYSTCPETRNLLIEDTVVEFVHLHEMYQELDIPQDWASILESPMLEQIIHAIERITPTENIVPAKNKWFEWASAIPLQRVSVIIVSSDIDCEIPYILDRSGSNITSKDEFKKHLEQQGVLWLTTSLTQDKSFKSRHLSIWESFMKMILKKISSYGICREKKYMFFFWGTSASMFKKEVYARFHMVYSDVDPSKPSFRHCNHFTEMTRHRNISFSL